MSEFGVAGMATSSARPVPRLDVAVQGNGPALLLTHGAGGGIEADFGPSSTASPATTRSSAPITPAPAAPRSRPAEG
ncbi:hypothetical protein [Streptomyces sp. NPDC014733]|uniref:hypothetical protein n=1 Tax=Streptomyces sp. NPDC014733 TaxID=3364885 RepID=UPI0036FAEDBC